ncbi:MAG: TonB-dependent receptor, partial [Flavipsychrobacter sp.]|nr:TonB-dependent receptor [Flavipsychrobacter sp.]
MDVADSNGTYAIQIAEAANLLVKAIAAGYAPGYIIAVTDKPQDIILKPLGKELAAVTVNSSRPLIERKADRMVLNVENTISAIGSDAFELLKKAPGVRVGNSSVSIAGKNTVSIMVDDRLLQLGGEELEAMLRTIKADNISKIEVITTPPAKYDAEGNTGIINIVTAKRKREGLNGNVYLTSWLISDAVFSRYELGADYNISRRAILGIMYTIGHTNRFVDQAYVNTITSDVSGNIDSLQRSRALVAEKGLRNVIHLNYEWKIDSG